MCVISQYEFGCVVVDGKTYRSDLLILPDAIHADWWREEGHELRIADLWELERLADPLAVLVVGTGESGRMAVPAETCEWLAGQGIELRIAPTAGACDLYNALASRGVRVAAALHLTC